jgi:integrase/recombinase XerD
MSLGKQAKVLSKQQQDAVLAFLKTTRQPLRNRVIFLLSVRAGLRAKEIASLTWDMVCNASNELSDAISLQDVASKGAVAASFGSIKSLKTH